MPKCADCGFLAVRDEYNDAVMEATDFTRDRGQHQSSQGNATRAKVFCYLDEPLLSVNFDRPNEIPAQLRIEHQCSSWMKWRPGKSPKEHEEMQLLREVENRNREAEAKNRQWQESVERKQSATATRRFWIEIAIIVVLTIVGSILQREDVFKFGNSKPEENIIPKSP